MKKNREPGLFFDILCAVWALAVTAGYFFWAVLSKVGGRL